MFYLPNERVLPSHEEILRCAQEGCVFYLPNERVLPTHEEILRCAQEGCVFYQLMNKPGVKASCG
ncbi:MAG: hypothetical protein ACPGWR_22780 [Ardenticatenaceae bacterium]